MVGEVEDKAILRLSLAISITFVYLKQKNYELEKS